MMHNDKGRLAVIAITLISLAACRATDVSNVSRDSAYDPRGMRRVLVMAVVKTDRSQKILEDELVKQLAESGREAVASHTQVPRGTKLEEAQWKSNVEQ